MLSRLLRQLLFSLIHLVMDVLVAVQNFYQQFSTKKCSLPEDNLRKSDIRILLEHVPRITKRPKHVVFLADTNYHTFSDLAHLVIWSLVAGIPYVSFHDITGEISENEEKLFLEVEKHKKGIPGCIKWSKKPDLNGYSNGIQAHTVNVNIFTNSDGRSRIAQCIRDIAKKKIALGKKTNEFTAQDLNNVVSLVYPTIPDPEIVLYTGEFCCTHGVLPWQIRLTEFIKLSLDHNVNINSYLGAMYKYSKCDQRFGK